MRQLEEDLGLVGSGGGSEIPVRLTEGTSDGGPIEASLDAEGASDASPEGGNSSGSVSIEASVELVVAAPYDCPGINAFSISPAAVSPGQPALLQVALIGPPASVLWTATPAGAGAFSDNSALQPTFLCAGVGAVGVTVVASLIDGGSCEGVRFTSFSGTIDCLPR